MMSGIAQTPDSVNRQSWTQVRVGHLPAQKLGKMFYFSKSQFPPVTKGSLLPTTWSYRYFIVNKCPYHKGV